MTLRQADSSTDAASLHSCHSTQLLFFLFFLNDIQLNPQSRRETQFVKVGIVMATPSPSSLPLSQTDTPPKELGF